MQGDLEATPPSGESGAAGGYPQAEIDNSAKPPRAPRRLGWPQAIAAVVLATAVALGAAALATEGGAAAARTSGVAPRATITVTGSGTVEGTPDTVSFQIGVHTSAVSATGALSENDVKMAALQASLLKSGVLKKNMQTSNLNISENQNSKGIVTGFSVDDELNVTMHNIASAGRAIDAAANAAGNGIELNGVTFSISNQSGLLAAARAKAVQSAHTEAQQVAAGAGLALGGVASMTDQENSSQPITFSGGFPAFRAAATSLQAGTQPVSVQVRVVYLLGS